MGTYHNIRIDHNSDCWGEIERLRDLLRHNKHYLAKEFSNAEIVAIAIGELYDKLAAEKQNGENQRNI